jgi:hypothetical protein
MHLACRDPAHRDFIENLCYSNLFVSGQPGTSCNPKDQFNRHRMGYISPLKILDCTEGHKSLMDPG